MLNIKNLSISFSANNDKVIKALDNVSFDIDKKEIFSLIGESGSGKSISALAILRLLDSIKNAKVSGDIIFNTQDISKMSLDEVRKIRGNEISMIFQEPSVFLNPIHTVYQQISEPLKIHSFLSKNEIYEKVAQVLQLVDFEDCLKRLNDYPHQFSGGQKQRIMIAMALITNPKLLIADEPTTALDATTQKAIIELFQKINNINGTSILLISHDLNVVKKISHKIAIIKNGVIVETNKTDEIFNNPVHPYTKELINSEPKGEPIQVDSLNKNILNVKNLKVDYQSSRFFNFRKAKTFYAVDNVDFCVQDGRTLGIIGESGSGKTSLMHACLRLIKSSGSLEFLGKPLPNNSKQMRAFRKDIQVVFQDPFGSLNPKMMVIKIIKDGLDIHKSQLSESTKIKMISNTLKKVGLDDSFLYRYPHELSGGQRQRISIARAIILKPKIIFLDEPTSALDYSMQKEVLNLLKDIQQSDGTAYVFITHDLKVIKTIAHDLIVMKNGKIVEYGNTNTIINNPNHEYTKHLLNCFV